MTIRILQERDFKLLEYYWSGTIGNCILEGKNGKLTLPELNDPVQNIILSVSTHSVFVIPVNNGNELSVKDGGPRKAIIEYMEPGNEVTLEVTLITPTKKQSLSSSIQDLKNVLLC